MTYNYYFSFFLINFFMKGKHNSILVSSLIILSLRGTFKSNLKLLFDFEHLNHQEKNLFYPLI